MQPLTNEQISDDLEQDVTLESQKGADEIRQSIFDCIPENALDIIADSTQHDGVRYHMAALVLMRDKTVDHLEVLLDDLSVEDNIVNKVYSKALRKMSTTKKYKFYRMDISNIQEYLGVEYVTKFKKLIIFLAQGIGFEDCSSLLICITKYSLTLHNEQERASFKQLLDYVK